MLFLHKGTTKNDLVKRIVRGIHKKSINTEPSQQETTMKNTMNSQCLFAKKPYQKALMRIVEIETVDVLTASNEPTRQLDNFQKKNTDDWF